MQQTPFCPEEEVAGPGDFFILIFFVRKFASPGRYRGQEKGDEVGVDEDKEKGALSILDIVAKVDPVATEGTPKKGRKTKYGIPSTECPRCWLEKSSFPIGGRSHDRTIPTCNKHVR